jgi:hypothetical protein
MRKKSASGVLASLRGSPYGAEYDSPLRSLQPYWTDFLRILQEERPGAFVIRLSRRYSTNREETT